MGVVEVEVEVTSAMLFLEAMDTVLLLDKNRFAV